MKKLALFLWLFCDTLFGQVNLKCDSIILSLHDIEIENKITSAIKLDINLFVIVEYSDTISLSFYDQNCGNNLYLELGSRTNRFMKIGTFLIPTLSSEDIIFQHPDIILMNSNHAKALLELEFIPYNHKITKLIKN